MYWREKGDKHKRKPRLYAWIPCALRGEPTLKVFGIKPLAEVTGRIR